ncbi:IS66 family insertion sequence element accessory protein TnpA [Endothiovibrio diazotrophicus]
MSEQHPETPRSTYWRKQLRAWRTSGQSQLGFCKQQGLSYAQFQYWRRKLTASTTEERPPTRSEFVTVRHRPMEDAGGLTLVLPNGAELRGIHADNLSVVESLLRLTA